MIDAALLEKLKKRGTIRISAMADSLLAYCVRGSQRLGASFSFDDAAMLRACCAMDFGEAVEIARYQQALGLMWTNGDTISVLPLGFRQIEEGGSPRTESNQAFVAMWFDERMTAVYDDGFSVAISEAGFETLRIDRKEHNRKIDDEIIAEIRRSKFLVADFTQHRGGVYFEAGFAMGLGLPVIWCCRKDHIAELHFDIRQYNCIDWVGADDLRPRLTNRILALIGKGRGFNEA